MYKDSLSIGYIERKMSAGWEEQGGGIGKVIKACAVEAFKFINHLSGCCYMCKAAIPSSCLGEACEMVNASLTFR